MKPVPYSDKEILRDRVREALTLADQLRLVEVGIALNEALIGLGEPGTPPTAAWSMTDDLIIN